MKFLIKLYYSNHCRYCRMLEKTLDEIAKERDIEVEKICIDGGGYDDIKFTPTAVVFYDGIQLGKFSSALAKSKIDKWLDELEVYVNTYLKKER